MSAGSRRLFVARVSFAFGACVVVTHIVASLCQSLLVMAALERAGGQFTPGTRLHVIGHDIIGLIGGGEVSFAGLIVAGLALGLATAAAVSHFLRVSASVTYPLAGAATLAVILQVVQLRFFYNMTFMEGTRGAWGYASQLMAGAIGGATFLWLLQPKRRP